MKGPLSLALALLAALSIGTPVRAQGDDPAALAASCDQGELGACVTLGRRHAAAAAYPEAISRFRHACEQGEMSGCHEVAPFYLLGIGGVAANEAFSVQLYQLACERDYGPSCTELGRITITGAGVPQDDLAALLLFQKGCKLKDGAGCTELGDRYYKGEAGAPQDNIAAFGWFADGCGKGDPQGCIMAEKLKTGAE